SKVSSVTMAPHRDLDPFLRRTRLVARALPAACRRHRLVAVVEGSSLEGRIRQHLADAGDRPGVVAGRAGDPVLVEAPADAPHGVAVCHEVVEDAADHRRRPMERVSVAPWHLSEGYVDPTNYPSVESSRTRRGRLPAVA